MNKMEDDFVKIKSHTAKNTARKPSVFDFQSDHTSNDVTDSDFFDWEVPNPKIAKRKLMEELVFSDSNCTGDNNEYMID